ncbi:RNA-directed DNA polymerase, eukaryota [Tanacetum coccineum]
MLLVAVYAPHDKRDKRMLWDYLSSVVNNWDGEVIMMGDFNEVRTQSERFGSTFYARDADVFNSFIYNSSLVEVPLGGSAFTWCHKSATKMSKLDRFLISENLWNSHPNINAVTLDRHLSDHRPILLRESITDYGPTPFRFYNSWIEIDGFKELVEDSWRDAPVDNCNGMRTFMFKLKFLKNKIKEWNSRFLKNSKADLTRLQEELKQIDAEIDCGKGNDSIVAQRLDVMNSINNIVKIYDSQALQKAKIKWAVEGDENSRFFHGIINKRRKQRSIRGVMKDGVWLDKPEDVKYEFLSHFRDRFTHSDGIRVPIDMEFPNSISSSQQVELESDVTTAEIKRAVWDCGVDKSPGPDEKKSNGGIRRGADSRIRDGITFHIDIGVSTSIGNVSHSGVESDVYYSGSIKRGSVGFGLTFSGFSKSAFPSRGYFRKSLMISVQRWDFLDEVLRKYGFGDKWRRWIQSCLSSSRGSILINGSPTSEFQFL